MKYIRTDKGVYERDKCKSALWKMKVIKEADTIKELCDEYVAIINDDNALIPKDKYLTGSYNLLLECCLIQQCPKNEYYGAIWTNKGLIYVAKMNQEGVLELIE